VGVHVSSSQAFKSSVAVIAHRGASRSQKENTVEAFVKAAQLGAHAVELDVRITADDALIVHHDAHINVQDIGVQTKELRAICQLHRDELPAYVPSLEQALDACEGMWVNIEIKNDPRDPDFDTEDRVVRKVAEHLHQRNTDDRWVISSFRRETIDVMRALTPSIRTAWLTLGHSDSDAAAVARSLHNAGHYGIHPWEKTLTMGQVSVFREQGLAINVWTCDDATRMTEFAEWGIDGICTNVPDVAVSTLYGC
jgi:glycerophosphoryl diester phosphodiesterase